MTSTGLPRVLVDVTQYVTWPATSGVQRVLLHLAREWREKNVEARFGFIENQHYLIGPLRDLGSVVDSVFRSGGRDSADAVRGALRRGDHERVQIRDIPHEFAAYLLPEPTLRRDTLAVMKQLLEKERILSFFVYFDSLPLTCPEFYPRGADGDGIVTQYHQTIASADNIVFISPASKRTFEQRIARRTLTRSIVARPGADALPYVEPRSAANAIFTVLGTVEPRKRHRVILQAFERLWAGGRDFKLVILGAEGWEDRGVIRRLRELAATSRVKWIEGARDEDVTAALAASSAVLFTPYAEGYGLPPLEALFSGCPAIVSADLPSLESISDAGQIRLDVVTAETIAAAVETLAEPNCNEAYRSAIQNLVLPTWRNFVDSVENWVASALRGDDYCGEVVDQENVRCPN
jgi:glycosyltransferase involved in cell wall biosynthesis